MIASAIRSLLLGDSIVSANTGGQIYTGAAPPGITGEWIIVQRISDVAVEDSQGATGLTRARVQISIWTKSQLAVDLLGEEVRLRVQGYGGEIDNISIQRIHLDNQTDVYQPPQQGQGVGYFGRHIDLGIWYAQAIPA